MVAKDTGTVNVQDIVTTFSGKVKAKYQLGDDFMTDVESMMSAVLAKFYIFGEPQQLTAADESAGKKKAKGPKKPRKTSAYNVYVKEKMQEDTVKAAPQKQKMGLIGAMWKQLDDAGKAPFKVKADALNAANPALQALEAEKVAKAAAPAEAPAAAAAPAVAAVPQVTA